MKYEPLTTRFERYYIPEPMSGCWLWTAATDASGYGRIWDGRRWGGAHRVSYVTHKGPIPPGMFVCHHCDVRPCVNPDHLFLGTNAANMADMARKGRRRGIMVGEANPKAKLTAAQVAAIRHDSRRQVDIASDFGMSQAQVGKIKQGLQWSHIPMDRPDDEYAWASALGRTED